MKTLIGFGIKIQDKIFAYVRKEYKESLDSNYIILGEPSLENSSLDILDENEVIAEALNNVPNIENMDFRESQKIITKGFIFDNGAFMTIDLVQEQLIKLGAMPKEIEPHYYGDTHFSQEQFFMALILPERFTLRYKIKELFKGADMSLSDIVYIRCIGLDKDLRNHYKEGLVTTFDIKIQTKTSIIKIIFRVERFFEVAYPFSVGMGQHISIVDIEKERIIGVAENLDKLYCLIQKDETFETLKFKHDKIEIINEQYSYDKIVIPTHDKLKEALDSLLIINNADLKKINRTTTSGYVTNFGRFMTIKEALEWYNKVNDLDLKHLHDLWKPVSLQG